MSSDEAGENWRDQGGDLERLLMHHATAECSETTYVRINIETLVFKHGRC